MPQAFAFSSVIASGDEYPELGILLSLLAVLFHGIPHTASVQHMSEAAVCLPAVNCTSFKSNRAERYAAELGTAVIPECQCHPLLLRKPFNAG